MPELGEIRKGTEIGYKLPNKCIYIACPLCSKERWIQLRKGNTINRYCRSCSHKGQIGEKASRWKGGRNNDGKGYILVKVLPDNPYYSMANSNGYILEHRLIMAQKLGRPLGKWEIVHHKDSIKHHNTEENLELVSHLENLSADLILANQKQLLQEIRILRLQVKELSRQLQGRFV